jgi:tetratricopeptide (TPR) repeat protein
MEDLVTDNMGLPRGGDLYFWAFFLCLRQEAIATVTGQPAPADPWQHLNRGRVYVKLGESDKAEAEFQAAVKAQPDDPRIWLARSRIYAGLGKQAEAQADRAQATQLAEQALAKRPDDNAAAVVLTDFLLEKAAAKWTVLKPLTVKSEGGATLTVQPDDSVLAGGVNPDQDVYLIETEVPGRIGAIRLEVIPDASLPAGGSGRGPTGRFVLTDFRVLAGESVVSWSRANADFSQETENGESKKLLIAYAIDADESTGWSIGYRVVEPHWAVFIPHEPIAAAGKTRLKIRLAFRNKEKLQHTLGRFRLSVTDDAALIQQSDLFLAASTPLARVGAAYLALDDAKQAADFLTKATAANPKLPATDWLVLALAHAKLNETDQAKKAFSKAAERLPPGGINDALRPLLREVLRLTGTNHAEAVQLLAVAAGKPPASLNEAIQKNPKEVKGYRDRGYWYAVRGQWKEAVDDLAEAYRLAPTSIDALWLGVLLAQIGDAERYRKHGQEVLTRFESTKNNMEAERALKTGLLFPDSKLDPLMQSRLAEIAVSGDPKQGSYHWFLFAKGLYNYRTGKYTDALTAFRESRRRTPKSEGIADPLTAMNLIGAAMALHQTGDQAAARRTLTEAQSRLDFFVPGIDTTEWHDWLAAHLLYREAEGLIAGKKAEVPR